MTEAEYLRAERIAIKLDSGIPLALAEKQADDELSPRQMSISSGFSSSCSSVAVYGA